MDYFKLAADLARYQLTGIEQHWLAQDVEQSRAMTLYESLLTIDDLMWLWVGHINQDSDHR